MTKMLNLIQQINSEIVPPGQSHGNASVDAFKYVQALYERLGRGKDSTKLQDYQDHEAAAEALTYLLWEAIKRGPISSING